MTISDTSLDPVSKIGDRPWLPAFFKLYVRCHCLLPSPKTWIRLINREVKIAFLDCPGVGQPITYGSNSCCIELKGFDLGTSADLNKCVIAITNLTATMKVGLSAIITRR